MLRTIRLAALFISLVLPAAAPAAAPPAAAPPSAPPFRAGFAERDITPDLGMEQPGNYMKNFHRVKHDACKVRAAVFDDGKSRVAIVGVDALVIYRPSVEIARKAIQEKTGIPAASILIAASHTHAGGPTGMILPGEFDGESDLVKDLAYNKSSCADAGYLKRVEQAIADAVIDANGKLAATKIAIGSGIEDKVSFNRRFHMKNGLTFTHPGQNNPEIIDPAGPIDPRVGVIGAWDKDGNLVGCIVNFACHATTGPGGTSADYIYYIEKTIRGLLGEQAIVVFLQGACGDVTQVDNRLAYDVRQSGEQASRLVGGRVGAEALKVLLSIQSSAGMNLPLAARTRILQIKRRVPAPDRVQKCLEIVKRPQPKTGDISEWIFAKEIVLLDAIIGKSPAAWVEVQAIQVGPAVILACPAEYFCQYGLDLRARSNFTFTFPVELANDCVGYVPTAEAMGKTGGGYETRLTAYSNLEPAAGGRIADALIELARELVPGPVPTPSPARPFGGKTWGYGSQPPELE